MRDGNNGSRMNRRDMLKATGVGSLIGVSGIYSTNFASAEKTKTSTPQKLDIPTLSSPDWNKVKTVEQDIGNNLSVNFAYFGTELQSRWVDGEKQERHAHFFELTCHAKCERNGGCHNITSQEFEAKRHEDSFGDIEVHEIPKAGATAWPDPPGGNWDEVTKTVVEEATSSLSSIVGGIKSVSDIYESYKERDFTSNEKNKIAYQDKYRTWSRKEASHSVNFTLDTKIDEMVAAEIKSGVGETWGLDQVAGKFKTWMKNDRAQYPFDDFEVAIEENGSLYEALESKSESELNEHGIYRIKPDDVTLQDVRESRLDLSSDEPTYVTTIPMDVEFEEVILK